MTVAELIEELQKLDPDLTVVKDIDDGINQLPIDKPRVMKVQPMFSAYTEYVVL